MNVVRRLTASAGMALFTVSLAMPAGPAYASNGTVTSKVVTGNGGGAYAKVTMHWTSPTGWAYDHLKVDDLCNAKRQDDGKVADLKMWIRRGSTTQIAAETPDLGGCRSTPVIQRGGTWSGATPVDALGIQVCVGKWDSKRYHLVGPVVCDKTIHWLTNQRR